MGIRWKNYALTLGIIMTAGVLRLPFEREYTASLRAKNLLETPLNLSARDELGQSLFIATLGGFRGPVASIMELRSVTPWMRGEWGRVEECYAICTRLQPREEHYWEQRAYQQAFNARDYYLLDSTLTKANRELYAQRSVETGLQALRDGTQRLPESWRLWERLAFVLRMPWNQQPDYAAASAAYEKAAAIPGSPPFLRRFAVYELTRIPEREREAWDRLLALYNDPREHLPTVDVELLYLYFERKIKQRHPDIELPAELQRLVTPGAVLNAEEKKRLQFLSEALGRRMRPEGIDTKAPKITSPHFQPQK